MEAEDLFLKEGVLMFSEQKTIASDNDERWQKSKAGEAHLRVILVVQTMKKYHL